MANRKSRFALLSIVSNSFLIIIKIIVGGLSGSVSIISEAIHSSMDLVASIIAFISVRISDTPPDKDHPYGHGKVENVSGVIEAILILAASVMIITEAIKKLSHHDEVGHISYGFIVMFVSATVNWFISQKLYKVAKEEDSIALAADALHLKADVWTSLGVGVGLFAIWLFKIPMLDPLVAIAIAVFITKEAIQMLMHAFEPLLDAKLSDSETASIQNVLNNYAGKILDFHELRSRRSGKYKQIDLHLTVPGTLSTKESHDICDQIEKDIERALHHTSVLIHVEPCNKECVPCYPASGCTVSAVN